MKMIRSTFILALTLVSISAAQAPIEGDPAHFNPQATTAPAGSDVAIPLTGSPRAGEHATILPPVRLTPRDVHVPGLEQSRVSLDGVWQFSHSVPAGFRGEASVIEHWKPIPVPGHFALHGPERMHKDEGVPVAWMREVSVPAEWRGRRVILRFEGVDGLTRLWVNGREAGESDIACLPSEFDVTNLVLPGETNHILLTIEKSLVTRWSRRELGGITRSVYLQALPQVNLGRLHVDTQLVSGEPHYAVANVHLLVANQSAAAVPGAQVALRLVEPDGTSRPLLEKPVPLPAVAAGQSLTCTIPARVTTPRLWSAESPTLYHVEADLIVGGVAVMTARQRFGFREVAVRGHELLINGRAVKLRGTNYHITYPGSGETVAPEQIRRDIELFQQANINTLRSRPTPSIEYVELCDEMGMYTTVEAMISLMMYDAGPKKDHGADPAIAGPYRHHVATMIESMYSNPSIITWGLGNECPYYDYFQTAALGMRAADRTRPLFFGSDARLGVDVPFMDINDDHYPRDGVTTPRDPGAIVGAGWDYPKDRPNIFTEWMHVHTNNVKELLYDPGIDDYWGYVAEAHIEFMYRTPEYAGGFHFKGAPYRGIGVEFPWRGMFEEDRTPNQTFWHTKKAHSPVRVADRAGVLNSSRTHATFAVTNRFDFTKLSDLTFSWRRGDAGGTVPVDVFPQQTGTLEVPFDPAAIEPTTLEVTDARGRLVDRYTLTLADEKPPVSPPSQRSARWDLAETDDAVTVSLDRHVVEVDRRTGLLRRVTAGSKPLIDGPPTLSILPAQLRKFRGQEKLTLVNQAFGWHADEVAIERRDDEVRVSAAGRYQQQRGRFITEIRRTGIVRVSYDFEWTQAVERPINCFAWGLAIPVVEQCDTLFWRRNAQWSSYPDGHIGRPVGEARPNDAPGGPNLALGPAVDGVSADFRATRFFAVDGGLRDSTGAGIRVLAGGRHLQAVPINGDLDGQIFVSEVHGQRRPGYFLHVHRFHNGGTEPHLTKSLTFETLDLQPGARFADEVEFQLLP